VPEYFTEFTRGGEKATRALDDGAKRFDQFRGSRVFETRPFDTDFMSAGSIEPLMRDREIGEYYELAPVFDQQDAFDAAWGALLAATGDAAATAAALKEAAPFGITKGEGADNYGVDLAKTGRAIRIFDMSQDKFATITYKDAIQNSWKGDADKSTFAELVTPNTTVTLGDLRAHGLTDDDLDAYLAEINPIRIRERGSARFLGTDKDNNFAIDLAKDAGRDGLNCYAMALQLFVGQGKLIVPHKLLLFRPRMCYRMGTAILLKGGVELGQTLHGHHDFQLTDDVIHKTHIGHYTFYSKSVVREPKNMYMAEDVYCAGYNGGENIKFIQEDSAGEAFGSKVNHRSPSIICIAVPPDTETPACMSVTGSFEEHGLQMADNISGSYSTKDIVTAKVESYISGEVNTGLGDSDSDTMNGICFRGATQTQASRGAPFVETQRNTGHWGPSVYDGCASVRQGLYAHLRPPGTQTVAF